MKLNRIWGLPCLASLLVICAACTSTTKPQSPTTNAVKTSPTAQPFITYPAPLEPVAPPNEIAELQNDLVYLASDQLEGRGVGTKGLDLAADYIAERFKALGLRPVGSCPDYFQRFTMHGAVSVDPRTVLRAGEETFELSNQYTPLGFSAQKDFSGPLVFAGYGISNATEHNYDDYGGIDVKGKVVMVFRFEPHNQKGTSRFAQDDWSADASLSAKAQAAAAHGAAAILLVNPPRFHGGDRLISIQRGGGTSDIPFLHITQKLANNLLKCGGSEKNLESLQTAIDASGQPQSFMLKDLDISGSVALNRTKVPVRNVMACLPGGSHPEEYVIVGAHYDHLGRGGSGSLVPGSHDIHHGADDNASGTTAVLDLAQRLVYAGRRNRSIVFVLFTGEEEGLIGSAYFVEHPPVSLDHVIAMINMDMVGRIRNQTLYLGGTGTAEAFDRVVNAADRGTRLQIKSIGKGGWGPTDHQSFAMKKIPVLFLFSGMHSDYHTPTDTADKINYRGISQVVDLAERIVDQIANLPRQQYVAAYDSQRLAIGGTGSRGGSATLGVVPDYGTDESTVGVRITGTSPDSPARIAGLRDGDVIRRINDRKIDNLYDLTDFLARAKPGDEVDILVEREKQQIQLHARLGHRKEG